MRLLAVINYFVFLPSLFTPFGITLSVIHVVVATTTDGRNLRGERKALKDFIERDKETRGMNKKKRIQFKQSNKPKIILEEKKNSLSIREDYRTKISESSSIGNDDDNDGVDLDDVSDEESKRWFVQYSRDVDKEKIMKSSHAVREKLSSSFLNDRNIMVVEIDESNLHRLSNENVIISAQRDGRVEATGSIRNVPLPSSSNNARHLLEEIPWGIKMIQADQLDVGPHPVKCCIVDTGYALDHPDLPTNNVSGDNSVRENWDWKVDLNGHGTHIAGTIAALRNNSLGIVGAGEIPLHITRGLDDQARGFESTLIDAIEQCIAAGAKIINVSLGGNTMSENSREFYSRAVKVDGVMIVAAAGNQGAKIHQYPASHPDVISVAAVYSWGRFWDKSNYSDQVELAAPGHGILSTTVTFAAVSTTNFSHRAVQVDGTRSRNQRGLLLDCGSGNYVCGKSDNGTTTVLPGRQDGGICLMYRDHTHLNKMVQNCEDGGGKGVIVFDANPALSSSTINTKSKWTRSSLSVVFVPMEVGETLLASFIGTVTSIGFHDTKFDPKPTHSYAYFEGTSMAVPHVVAAAALVWSYFPECSNNEIRYALAITASDQGKKGCDWDYGYGIVKAKDAYDWLLSKQKLREPCGSGSWGQPLKEGEGGCNVV